MLQAHDQLYDFSMHSTVTVHTYSGYKSDEYPLRFEIDGVCREIVSIEDRWYDPAYEAFKVFADDGHTYILRNKVHDGCWDMMAVK